MYPWYVCCSEDVDPNFCATEILARQWSRKMIYVITVTSVRELTYLGDMLSADGANWNTVNGWNSTRVR